MVGDLSIAVKQFEENVRLLGPEAARREPEKFNLYMGLANIAAGLADLTSKVETVQRQLQRR